MPCFSARTCLEHRKSRRPAWRVERLEMMVLAQPLLSRRVAGRRRRTRVVRSAKGRWLVRPRRPPTAAATCGLGHYPDEPAQEDGSEPYSPDHQPTHRDPEATFWRHCLVRYRREVSEDRGSRG